jgi:hypothetical protein
MNLVSLIKVKQLLKRAGVETLTVGPGKIALTPSPRSMLDPARAIALMASQPQVYQLLPDSRFVMTATCTRMDQVAFELERLIARLLA